MPYRFVESPNKTETSGRTFDVVVMHTMEIAERPDAAMICARWFATSVSKVSAHYCVDAQTVVQCVREKDVAWHARGGMGHASVLVADGCRRRRVPTRWLTADDLLAGRRGITGHAEVSRAYRKSDHWDPGPGFPVVSFLDRVRRAGQAQARA